MALNESVMGDDDPVYAGRNYVVAPGEADPLVDQVAMVYQGNGVPIVSDIGTDDEPATAADLAAELGAGSLRSCDVAGRRTAFADTGLDIFETVK